MDELALATAFTAGLLGSAHCAAMCGGIATALGATRAAGAPLWLPVVQQLGRVGGYVVVGSLAGALGLAAGAGFGVLRWAEILRLATALVIVLIGLDLALGGGWSARWLRAPERLGGALWRRLAPRLPGWLPAQPVARALLLGVFWGWLPCGLVYTVLLAATVSGSAWRGGSILAAFGLGTLPAMLGLSLAGARFTPRRPGLRRFAGAAIAVCGLWTAALPLLGAAAAAAHPGSAVARICGLLHVP